MIKQEIPKIFDKNSRYPVALVLLNATANFEIKMWGNSNVMTKIYQSEVACTATRSYTYSISLTDYG